MILHSLILNLCFSIHPGLRRPRCGCPAVGSAVSHPDEAAAAEQHREPHVRALQERRREERTGLPRHLQGRAWRYVTAYSSFTLHGTGNGTGNDGLKYYAMYCTHYTGTGTGNGTGHYWVPYPFPHSWSRSRSRSRPRSVWMSHYSDRPETGQGT